MNKWNKTTAFAMSVVLGISARAAALPSNPCSIVPKAQVEAILGSIERVIPHTVSRDGMRAMSCTYLGPRHYGLIDIISFANSSAAHGRLAQLAPRHVTAVVRGNILVMVGAGATGTKLTDRSLSRKLLAAVQARL